MSPGPTFDRVYRALKEQLCRGAFAPGAALEPAALGSALNASITPVRDALHRLVGEGLVEAPRSDGFRVPSPTEAELRDLYGWSRVLLDLALRGGPARQPAAGRLPPGLSSPPTAALLFRSIARRPGSGAHAAAVDTLQDRLASFRLAEQQVFRDTDEELEAMADAWTAADFPRLRRLLAAYHRRRQRSAPDILVALRAPHRED